MNLFINITKALSDTNRVRVLAALRNKELCVCRIIELLQLAPSTVSKHLTVLKQAGLIEGRKEGRWMHYQIPDHPDEQISRALDFVFESIEKSPAAQADAVRLKQIIKIDIEELTQIYKKKKVI